MFPVVCEMVCGISCVARPVGRGRCIFCDCGCDIRDVSDTLFRCVMGGCGCIWGWVCHMIYVACVGEYFYESHCYIFRVGMGVIYIMYGMCVFVCGGWTCGTFVKVYWVLDVWLLFVVGGAWSM